MITLLLHPLRLLPLFSVAIASSPLRTWRYATSSPCTEGRHPGPKLRTTARLLWVGLARVWAGWRQALVIVSPDTVLRWRRRRVRAYWTRLSGRPTGGRPPVNAEIKALVTRMAAANSLWGAPRIQGELLKLGIDVADRTVSRLHAAESTQGSTQEGHRVGELIGNSAS
jgi:hypothetical protein